MSNTCITATIIKKPVTVTVNKQEAVSIKMIQRGLPGEKGEKGDDGDPNLQEAEFTVSSNGQTNFNIMASAVQLVAVSINGVDATQYFTINPPGSGIVVFTPTSYSTEIGDFIRIVYV